MRERDAGRSRERWIRLAGTLVSSALFLWLLSRQDWGVIWKQLRLLPWWLMLPVFALYVLGQVANATRWYILLRAQSVKIPFQEALKIVFAGAFVSNFLPSTIGGDTVRVVSVRRFAGGWVVSAASVVVDRLLNVIAMITTFPLSVITFWPWISKLLGQKAGLTAMVNFLFSKLRWSKLWNSTLEQLGGALRLWRDQPRQLLLAFATSWLSILVIFLAVWQVARGLGIQVALYQVIGINAITYLLTLLPISLNGYGVREIAMASLYLQVGATSEQAATLSLITRFFMLLQTLPGSLWLAQVRLASAAPRQPASESRDGNAPLC